MKKYLTLLLFLSDLGLNAQHRIHQGTEANVGAKPIGTKAIAKQVLDKGLQEIDLGIYGGTLLMHAMSELAVSQDEPKTLSQAIEIFGKFKSKEINGRGSFISYEAGGSGIAYLNYLKKSETLASQVAECADKMFKHQKRTSDGLMTAPWLNESLDQVMIDCAFAVTPFMLYSGLAMNKPEYVDLAVYETLQLFKVLQDPNGLIHQGRGFAGPNSISEDNWSRANGWGAYALAILVRDLPDSHPRKKEVNLLAKQFFMAILKYQNQQGLWNQEMTDHTSYVETSGSGLMLFGIGICIEKNVIDKSCLPHFIKGLRGYTSYITPQGSISNVTTGCLCPGLGLKKDYVKHPWKRDDIHAYGPVVLAFTQAAKMGIKEIVPAKALGCYVADYGKAMRPQAYVRYMPEANGNVHWENDRIGFRMYGPPVKDRVSSGIDVWTKSVKYPVVDKWYDLNNQGQPYHSDRGEGCDFFHVGFTRGAGGTAIWHNEKPYVSQPYTTHKILKNTEQEVVFEMLFDRWDVDGTWVSEKKTISMEMGSNIFKVTSTFYTDKKGPLTAAVGIACAHKPQITADKKRGVLAVWESYLPENGELGTVVVAKPSNTIGFKSYEKQEFILIDVQPGTPITYYVGAGWTKGPDFRSQKEWADYIDSNITALSF